MVLHVEDVGGWLTLMLTLTFGLVVAQDTSPVCPQPAPICRSYEIQSCEWALNMVPVYVCRTDLGGLLIGGGMGYQPRQQTVIYQNPYSQQPVFPPYTAPQPQPVYTTYTTRQPAQYRPASQFMTAREADAQPSSQNGQAGTGSQPGGFGTGSQPGGFANRPSGQGIFPGTAREPSSGSGQSQPSINSQVQQLGSYGQRSSGTPIYQGASQPASAAGSPQQAQPSYPGSQAMISEGSE